MLGHAIHSDLLSLGYQGWYFTLARLLYLWLHKFHRCQRSRTFIKITLIYGNKNHFAPLSIIRLTRGLITFDFVVYLNISVATHFKYMQLLEAIVIAIHTLWKNVRKHILPNTFFSLLVTIFYCRSPTNVCILPLHDHATIFMTFI